MSELNKTYRIREYNESVDKAFIMATWLRGLYYGDSTEDTLKIDYKNLESLPQVVKFLLQSPRAFSLVPKSIFMNNYSSFLEILLPKCKVKIACLIEDTNEILGFAVLSKDESIIHWVFVKKLYRNHGIAKSLVPTDPAAVSHLTAVGRELMKKFPKCVFNPFAY